MSAGSPRPDAGAGAPDSPERRPATSTRASGLSLLQHRRIRRVLLGLGLTFLLGFAVWWLRYRPYVRTEDARVAAPTITVAPEGAGGTVAKVLVSAGDVVEAGAALVELDSAVERVQLDRARARVALAEAKVAEAETLLRLEQQLSDASVKRARANVRSAQAVYRRTARGARDEELEKARAEVSAAEAKARQAKRDLERAEKLAANQSIPANRVEAARTAAASAEAALEARRASLALLERGSRPEDVSISRGGVLEAEAALVEAGAGSDRVAMRQRQLDEARAQAAQARADQKLAEIALDRATLKSRIGGTVVRVAVDPGDHLSQGQGAVTVVDLDHAYISANIEETEAAAVAPGQPVDITVDEGGELSGHVEVVTRSAASEFSLIPASNASGNFTKVVQRIPIRVALDPSARARSLRVGESVEIRVRVR